MNLASISSVFIVLLAVAIQVIFLFVSETPDLIFEHLPSHLQSWFQRGLTHDIDGFKVFCIDEGPKDGSSIETIIFIHGFPTSSFDYHKSIQFFKDKYRVVMCDHVGFGFSSKPRENFTQSMADLADHALMIWQKLEIRHAHIVAHDMGDSVLTEILTRRQKNLLPDVFNNFFKSITFTNGGMRYDLINFRLSQTLLTKPWLGEMLVALQNRIPVSIRSFISYKQLETLWSPKYHLKDELTRDIEDIQALMSLNGGDKIIHKTISYLHDRSRFETRWLKSLEHLDVPCLLFWGDADAVSPMEIPKSLARDIIPPKVFNGKTLKDGGHFLMLERPEEYAKTILQFVESQ